MKCGKNYLSIPKLQRLHRLSFGIDKQFRPTCCDVCNYIYMLELKLNHVSKRGARPQCVKHRSPIDMFGGYRADSRLVSSQWETSLQNNAVSHWVGANLESALQLQQCIWGILATTPAKSSVLAHWRYCSLALSHRYSLYSCLFWCTL